MKCRCPACGATLSLDTLVSHDDAAEALKTVLEFHGEIGKLLIQYLGLFRPANSALTFERVNRLLREILPDIQVQRIERNGRVFDAPPEAWIESLQTVLNNRKKLKQLKSHGYLYEIISQWQPTQTGVISPTELNATVPNSKTMGALAELENLKE